MKRFLLPVLGAVVPAVSGGCHSVDDDRIPVAPVNVVFNTVADWDIYGVNGAMQSRRFIREQREPRAFAWTANTFTGFGGILLVSDVMGEAKAYDLACPVERRADTRVAIDDEMLARCPVCGSTYDVFSLNGAPVGGPAARDHFGLRPYHVGPSRNGTAYRVISY